MDKHEELVNDNFPSPGTPMPSHMAGSFMSKLNPDLQGEIEDRRGEYPYLSEGTYEANKAAVAKQTTANRRRFSKDQIKDNIDFINDDIGLQEYMQRMQDRKPK